MKSVWRLAFTAAVLAILGCAPSNPREEVIRGPALEPHDDRQGADSLPIVPPGAPPPHATENLPGPSNSGLTKPN